MTPQDLARFRLRHLRIEGEPFRSPAELVVSLGALQAQDYPGALWSVGLRLEGATEQSIEAAIEARALLRTWPMRGTLHFVPPQDARWMVRLLTPRVISSAAARHRQLELTDAIFARSRDLVTDALQGGRCLTRNALFELLEHHGIATGGQRGYHILWNLAQEGLLCFGPHEGKQPTFVLLEEWVPASRDLAGEEALAELARRYFTSHGPATLQDFVWWTGLKVSDARTGLKAIESQLQQATVEGEVYWMARGLPDRIDPSPAVHLLPGFDEYLLGYRDRSAVLDPAYAQKIVPGGNGMFMPTLVIDGRVRGTWKRVVKKRRLELTPLPFEPLSSAEREGLAAAAERYGRFLGLPVVVV